MLISLSNFLNLFQNGQFSISDYFGGHFVTIAIVEVSKGAKIRN